VSGFELGVGPTALLSSLSILAGTMLLRAAWAQRERSPLRIILGWLSIAVGVGCAVLFGSEVGLVLAIAALSVAAYAVVAAGAERRTLRPAAEREAVEEPEERPTNWWRAIAKSLLAIVLAGVAAVGMGIAFAVSAPIAPTDRILIGGLLVPMLWGAGMAWTLADTKLVRATILLVTVSAFAYGIAFFPKLMSS
jgi:hypothetical protein